MKILLITIWIISMGMLFGSLIYDIYIAYFVKCSYCNRKIKDVYGYPKTA